MGRALGRNFSTWGKVDPEEHSPGQQMQEKSLNISHLAVVPNSRHPHVSLHELSTLIL